MNHLIAKVRDRKNRYRKIVSGDSYYSDIGIVESVLYNPATILENEQWYKLPKFSEQDYCLDILKNTWDSTAYQLISEIDSEKIDYLCAYQEGGKYYFQRIYKAAVLRKKHITIGDNVKYEQGKSIVVINEEPDTVYKKGEDCLYFKKLETIAPIFKGIDVLYKEATVQDVEEFFHQPFMSVNLEFAPENVGKANRKRLALVTKTLATLNAEQKKNIFEYTDEYYPELAYDGQKFTINNDEDLKNLLFGIEERFYTTPVTHERRAANSIVPIHNAVNNIQ